MSFLLQFETNPWKIVYYKHLLVSKTTLKWINFCIDKLLQFFGKFVKINPHKMDFEDSVFSSWLVLKLFYVDFFETLICKFKFLQKFIHIRYLSDFCSDLQSFFLDNFTITFKGYLGPKFFWKKNMSGMVLLKNETPVSFSKVKEIAEKGIIELLHCPILLKVLL